MAIITAFQAEDRSSNLRTRSKSRSSSGLGLRPFTAATGVRVPYGMPFKGDRMTTRDHLVVAVCTLGIWVGLKLIFFPDLLISMLGYIAIYANYDIFSRYAYSRK